MTRTNRIRNEIIHQKVESASMEDKMRATCLRWIQFIQRRPRHSPEGFSCKSVDEGTDGMESLDGTKRINIIIVRLTKRRPFIEVTENEY